MKFVSYHSFLFSFQRKKCVCNRERARKKERKRCGIKREHVTQRKKEGTKFEEHVISFEITFQIIERYIWHELLTRLFLLWFDFSPSLSLLKRVCMLDWCHVSIQWISGIYLSLQSWRRKEGEKESGKKWREKNQKEREKKAKKKRKEWRRERFLAMLYRRVNV